MNAVVERAMSEIAADPSDVATQDFATELRDFIDASVDQISKSDHRRLRDGIDSGALRLNVGLDLAADPCEFRVWVSQATPAATATDWNPFDGVAADADALLEAAGHLSMQLLNNLSPSTRIAVAESMRGGLSLMVIVHIDHTGCEAALALLREDGRGAWIARADLGSISL